VWIYISVCVCGFIYLCVCGFIYQCVCVDLYLCVVCVDLADGPLGKSQHMNLKVCTHLL